MKYTLLLASAAALAIAGCAKTDDSVPAPQSGDSAETAQTQSSGQGQINPEKVVRIAYQCQADGSQLPLTAAYAIVGGNVAAAQLNVNNSTSPVLDRIENADNNTFSNGSFTWSTEKADADSLDKADGIILSRKQTAEVNGKQETVDETMLKTCKVDAAATKALAAEEGAQKSAE